MHKNIKMFKLCQKNSKTYLIKNFPANLKELLFLSNKYFNKQNNDFFIFYYIDSDNDRIIIDSDNDLKVMYLQETKSCHKIYVEVKTLETSEKFNNSTKIFSSEKEIFNNFNIKFEEKIIILPEKINEDTKYIYVTTSIKKIGKQIIPKECKLIMGGDIKMQEIYLNQIKLNEENFQEVTFMIHNNGRTGLYKNFIEIEYGAKKKFEEEKKEKFNFEFFVEKNIDKKTIYNEKIS